MLAMKELLAGDSMSDDEFAFLTNYTTTRCWVDEDVSSTFDVPVIFPSWFPNDDGIRCLYPGLREAVFDSFTSYVSFIKAKMNYGIVVIPFDRFYVDYIEPKRHMGGHYVGVEDITENEIKYHDFVDDEKHAISLETLESATERTEHPYQYMGRTVLYADPEEAHAVELDSDFMQGLLSRRVMQLTESLRSLQRFSKEHVKDERLCHFYLKIALGGITYSDFYKKNGRYENYLFLKKIRLKIPALIARLICCLYVFCAGLFFTLYKKLRTTERQWRCFCRLYAVILRFERFFYTRLSNRYEDIASRVAKNIVIER